MMMNQCGVSTGWQERKNVKPQKGFCHLFLNFIMLFDCKLTGQAMFEPTCGSMSLVVRRNRM